MHLATQNVGVGLSCRPSEMNEEKTCLHCPIGIADGATGRHLVPRGQLCGSVREPDSRTVDVYLCVEDRHQVG